MRTVVLFFAVVIVVACGAALGTRALMDHHADRSDETMHRWLHARLNLTPAQVESLHQLELRFAADEKRLQGDLDEANRQLARTIVEDRANTPRVTAAVERVHHCMGELQKLSIAHLFEMRSHLTEEQNEKLMHYAEMALTNAP